MSTSKKINIVFILADDLAVWAVGCYGNAEIRTPNLDRVATTGVRFENFFVTIPVCSASRASFLTGRIPSQHGVHDFIGGHANFGTGPSFLDDEVCYTNVLDNNEWTCGLSGKWHLGSSSLPQCGFSHWFAHPGGASAYNDQDMIRNGITEVVPGYLTNVITDDALAYIDAHAEDKNPFYLSVHYTAPHAPWIGHPQDIVDSYDDCAFETCPQEPLHPWAKVPEDDADLPARSAKGLSNNLGQRESLKGYYAAVTAMDLDVERILDRLEEKELRENTLVIFTSDNGHSCGQHGFWGKGNGTDPVNMYENSIKVPFLATHPGVIPEGTVQSAMASAYDVLPTLLDYVDLPPPNTNLPGQSLLPVLKNERADGRDSVVIFDEYGYCRMIRTAEWKYIHRYPDGPHELYEVVNDPDDRNDLIADPAQVGRVKELRDKMETWFSEYVIPDFDGRKYNVAGYGQLRPVGKKWEGGETPFDEAVDKPGLRKNGS